MSYHLIFLVIFSFLIAISPRQAMAQMLILDYSENLLTNRNPGAQLVYTPNEEKAYDVLRLDAGVPSTIHRSITTNVSDPYYQNMSSQEYTIYYQRGGGQIPTLRSSCPPIHTKSIELQQAQEVKKLIEEAKFFDLPGNLLPKEGAADYIGYTITVVEEEGMKRKHTVETSQFSAPPELGALIKYLNNLCRNIQ
jgi:hypothetical protein